MWSRIASLGNVAYIASKLNSFRFHESNTSSKRYTPEAQAEFLACTLAMIFKDLTACSQDASSDSPISIMSFLILLGQAKRGDLLMALKSFRCKNFLDLVHSYNRLDRVPRLTKAVWILLGAINYCRYLAMNLPAFTLRQEPLLKRAK